MRTGSALPTIFTKYADTTVRPYDENFIYTHCGSRIRRSFYGPDGEALENLPLAGEDLFEWLDLFQALEKAREIFTMVELGAGCGRWLVAAATAMRRGANLPVRLIGVEAEHGHFGMMRQHFLDNEIDPDHHMLIEAAVTEKDGPVYFVQGRSEEWRGQAILPSPDYGFGDWPGAWVATAPGISLRTVLDDVDLVDLVDMDVQGAEAAVVRGSQKTLTDKVKRVHIGTHNAAAEGELSELFSAMRWECRNRYRCHSTVMTQFGEISFQDGIQTWINPKLS